MYDMGPGLANNMDGEGATAAEWLTAPLIGIGLVAAAAGEESYLHDGRACTIEEAILWHGGEGQQAKENFRTLPASDRTALIKFIRSL
ncbi:MAG: di-heme oxidoredictase family protein [Akkermansiaceae bacterium]